MLCLAAGESGQWKRFEQYGMTEDGQTMRVIYDAGGMTLWSRHR